jgi:hypothetical protein
MKILTIAILLIASTSFAGSMSDRARHEETMLRKQHATAKEKCEDRMHVQKQRECEDRLDDRLKENLTFLKNDPDQYFYEKDEKKETKNTSKYGN